MQDQFKRNRLAAATSPYLQQHKDNPVHWQPWEAAVFDEARARNVPVLLSIGYAACHWCHVMAHESFEDDAVAELMNAHFVCIKLDREERPDLDDIYMNALHMMGEQGGWPLTICLDADGRPFWGGTYFPKTAQYGRPGFMQILNEISRIWHEEPDKIQKNTTALTQSLTAQALADAHADMPDDLPLRAAQTLTEHIDMQKGGLNAAPKFPQPFLYQYLWHKAQETNNTTMRQAVVTTIEKICQGGIYDHLGGGFARYSVDADWLVPHFEKMLYDNALLLQLMTPVWRDTKSPLLALRISETIDWLTREMMLFNGAFAASLDADTQGEEGKFYVWSKAEIETVLGNQSDAFCAAYDISATGNFEGHNIPNLLAQNDATYPEFSAARSALLSHRANREPPARDDKILADWNGMMISALVDAAQTFQRDDWLLLAQKAFDAAIQALTEDDGALRHSARIHPNAPPTRLPVSLAADYGFLGHAAAKLYAATQSPNYLECAIAYAETLQRAFLDDDRGAYLTRNKAQAQEGLVNNRAYHDNAAPSANAAIHQLLTFLAQLTGDDKYAARAQDLFAALSGYLSKNYTSMTSLLTSHQAARNPVSVVLIGDDGALAEVAHRHPIANRLILSLEKSYGLFANHPAHGKRQLDGKPTAYICVGKTCQAPVTSAAVLTAKLDQLII